jgi:probable HAF family extracellular repeat protein
MTTAMHTSFTSSSRHVGTSRNCRGARAQRASLPAAVVFALIASLPGRPAHAADAQAPVHYRVQALSNEGGLYNATSINKRGWVGGLVNPLGDLSEHAALWRNGALTDLGTLGGRNSTATVPKNDAGWVVGKSNTAQSDPYTENFCGYSCGASTCPPNTLTEFCRGFLWQDKTRKMIPLPPLPAGLNSTAMGANNSEIVGASENGVIDGACQPPQMFDFEGVVWQLDSSGAPFIAKLLPPLTGKGDTVSAAFEINQAGIAVGGSGICGPLGPAISLHAVKWAADGQPRDLGSLGGVFGNGALAINDKGQIVGISDLPGDQVTHAVLFHEGEMPQDLGVLRLRPEDTLVTAVAINNLGEVVGESCVDVSQTDCSAFLWQNGVMTDLNTVLIGAPCSLHLQMANGINDRGEIAVGAFDTTFGDGVGVVLVPVEDETPVKCPP